MNELRHRAPGRSVFYFSGKNAAGASWSYPQKECGCARRRLCVRSEQEIRVIANREMRNPVREDSVNDYAITRSIHHSLLATKQRNQSAAAVWLGTAAG